MLDSENGDITAEVAYDLIDDENNSVVVPDSYSGVIKAGAFRKTYGFWGNKVEVDDQSSLVSISAKNITKIERNAFKECEHLSAIDFQNVTFIENFAFYGCVKLTNINLPNIDEICKGAFEECENLQEINIPSVTKIHDECFSGCKNLTQIDIQRVCKIESNTFKKCVKLQQISLPCVTEIEESAFAECSDLQRISIPRIEQLNEKAFDGCGNLSEITTSSAEQCELIFNNINEDLKRKVRNGECILLYGGEVWNSQAYVQEQERLAQERQKQEDQQILDNFVEAFKTPEENIGLDDSCPICLEQFNELEDDNFVCTIHEDPENKVETQICKNCFLELIKSRNYDCPIYMSYLEIPHFVIQAANRLIQQ